MTVSVILPIRNEAPFIEEVLRAVLAQDYPWDAMEVIVADGQSDDGTTKIVKSLAAQDNRLKLIENPQRITTTGLNLAIRVARGDLIMRVDGHGVVPPNYLSECVAWLQKTEASLVQRQEIAVRRRDRSIGENAVLSDARHPPRSKLTASASASCPAIAIPGCLLVVGGAWDCVGRGRFGQAVALATSSPFGVGNAQYRTCRMVAEPIETDSVPFWVLRREVFKQIGLFREEMLCHEDYELNHRLRRAGGRILLLPWLRSKYYVRSSLAGLARQYWRYGIWKGRFLRSHLESLRFRHCIPPLFVAAMGLAGAAACCGGAGRLSLAVLVVAYLSFLLIATSVIALSRSGKRKFTVCKHHRDQQAAVASRTDGQSPGAQVDEVVASSSLARHSSSSVDALPVFPLRLAPLLPLVFVTLHCCWGTGVWLGFLRGPVPGQPPKL